MTDADKPDADDSATRAAAAPDAPTDAAIDEPLGDHVLQLEITDVVAETDDARTLVFRPVARETGENTRLDYAPGQFLTVRVPSDLTGSVARCYSLCSSPFTDDEMAVTVKRTADGYASNWICEHAHVGMHMHVLAPSGVFTPKSLDDDVLLLAAGSGITPVMSICKSALSQGAGRVTLVYANRDERSVIFAGALRDLAAKHPDRLTVLHWLESVQGLPQAAALARLVEPYTERHAYICGPGPFMAAAREGLAMLGVPDERVHVEVFKSLAGDPFAKVEIGELYDDDEADGSVAPSDLTVTLDGETTELPWPRRIKLLDLLLDKGLDAPFSCREGHCGACACTLKKGRVSMEVNDVLTQQDLDDGLILACQSHPETDSVEVTYDE